MNLSYLMEYTYNRIDEEFTDREPQIDNIVKNAIAQAEIYIGTFIDKMSTTITLQYAARMTLPIDFVEVIELSHTTYGKLSEVDYEIKADLLIPLVEGIKTGTFTLVYHKKPAKIENESSSLQIKDGYALACSAFACYQYAMSMNRVEQAQVFLKEFFTMIGGGMKNET